MTQPLEQHAAVGYFDTDNKLTLWSAADAALRPRRIAHEIELCSAPAERSGDGALVLCGCKLSLHIESGVALRLPPRSKGHLMSEVAAILLAAGRSQRMGAFKPLLPFGETTVIRTCIQNLRQAGVEDIVVVLGHRAEEVQQTVADLNLGFATNPDPTSEMGASIACGLRELLLDTKAALIALTDQPAVPPDVIRVIVSEWTSGETLVIPEFQGRGGHPVLVDLKFREELLHLDSGGGLRSFLKSHPEQVRRLPVNSPFIARDMDTWDDYRALHQEVFGVPPVNQELKAPVSPYSSKRPLN